LLDVEEVVTIKMRCDPGLPSGDWGKRPLTRSRDGGTTLSPRERAAVSRFFSVSLRERAAFPQPRPERVSGSRESRVRVMAQDLLDEKRVLVWYDAEQACGQVARTFAVPNEQSGSC